MELPGISVTASSMTADTTVMVLGGRAPSAEWLRHVPYSELWAVDRGLEVCRRSELLPDLAVGDGDSCSRETLAWAERAGVPFEKFSSDKDLTDFQLALKIFVEKHKNNGKNIMLTGAFGGRFDHLWSLAATFVNCSCGGVSSFMADDREGMVILRSRESASLRFAKPPKAVSLVPFSPECTGVSISGVKWPLDSVVLKFSEPYAISNRALAYGDISASSECGILGLYWLFDEENPDIPKG